MTKLHQLTLLLLLALIAWAIPEPTSAQEERPTYVVLDYMKVTPGKGAEYRDLEQNTWKPIRQALIEDGRLVSWRLYWVRMPYGSENKYNLVASSVYDDTADVAERFSMEALEKAYAGTDLDEMIERTEAARGMVRSEVWQLLDKAESKASGELSPYIMVHYMKVAPGKEAEYLELEEIWQPVHQRRIDQGLIDRWELYRLDPSAEAAYSFRTVNAFSSGAFRDIMSDEIFYPEELFTAAHPNMDMSNVLEKAGATREILREQVWVLIDHVE